MNGFPSARAAWAALAVLLAVGLPIFLCMPLWVDATLYDLAAWNILSGGVPYRDVFDTNLPGMVWLHAAVRSVFGWRSEALRLVDFAVYAGIVALLLRWLRQDGVPRAARAWSAVALFAFYLSLTEWCHCQRDTWMLLPALAALSLRRHRLSAASPHLAWVEAGTAIAEGLLWGATFWIKPFVIVPALACAAVGAVFLHRSGRSWRVDAACVVAGGLVAVVLGMAWLWHTGAWPHFCDVFLHWNPEYAANSLGAGRRTRLLLQALKPWGWLHLAALPVAVLTLGGLRRKPGPPPAEGWGPALLGAFYLGWLLQAAYIQKCYDYSLASAVPLAWAVLARGEWRLRPRLALAAGGTFALVAGWHHPLLYGDRLALWPRCLREGSTAELRERLKLLPGPNTPNWVDLELVAEHLRRLGVGDGEVTCYNNSTHPLYLSLGLRPTTPFLHYNTVLLAFPSRREQLREVLARCGHQYVVSDLCALPMPEADAIVEQADDPLALPPAFPAEMTRAFPWSMPVRFRAGRYLVHEVQGEVGPLWIDKAYDPAAHAVRR